MTQDEIIEMAKQADFLTNELKSYVISPYAFEDADLYKELEAFANLVAQHEREACAKVCEDLSKDMTPIAKQAVKTCATFVRSRKS